MVDTSITGWMKPKELEWLKERASDCDKVLEVGSYHGRSTFALAHSKKVWCVDLWGTEAVGEDDYKEFIKNTQSIREKLTVMRGNSHDMLDKLIASDVRFDLAFVDGCHKYEFVSGDIERCLQLVRSGGIISGHDFSARAWPDVVKAVKQLVPGFNRVKGTAIWWKKI